jgi:magnesium transporter
MQKLRYHPPGAPPHHMVAPPDQVGIKPVIRLIEYDAHSFEEREITDVEEIFECADNTKVSWINIDGLGDPEVVRRLGAHFHIHPLALEDIFTTGQRPKVSEYEGHLFILLQMVYEQEQEEGLTLEQVSIVLGRSFVLTVQEEPGRDVFDSVRLRVREGCGNARFMRNDYLAYALIDSLVDYYFPVVESVGESIEQTLEMVLEQPTRDMLRDVHDFRTALSQLRRTVWPTRDVLSRLARDDSGLISDRTRPFIRESYDNSMAIIDLLEGYRDGLRNILDLYISSLSMRTNEVMRVLTVISSVFIPLTFIVGLYGMNFDTNSPWNMPELHWHYGYPAVVIVMLAIFLGMVGFFKYKRWL